MTASTPLPDVGSALRETLFAPIARDLQRVEEVLKRELRSDYPYVDELVRYGCLLGGKRLRPALLLLAAQCAGQVREEHDTLGAVVEMIHTATLVHDDVIDEADQRRHLATVNARWDNEASVLLGDFLFTHAFYLASTLPTTLACRLIGHATNIVCEGELRQKGSRAQFELSEAEYLSIIEAKTAELCAVSAELGAHYAGATSDEAQRLADYGRYLGIAFQIADDMLDLSGDEATVGKSLGTDLAKQKPTLPVIRLLQIATPTDRQRALAILQGGDPAAVAQLVPLLEQYATIEYSRQRADAFAAQAVEQLEGFASSAARDTLRVLAEFVVNRSH